MHIRKRLQQYINAGAVALAPGRYTPKWQDWRPPSVAEDSLLVFTAADSVYFRKFAPAFLYSLVRQHPSANVHFHLFDPDQECIETLVRWQAGLPSANIGYSRERLPERVLLHPKQTHSKQPWKSLYICCSRFLAAQYLQRRCKTAILVMDIDVIFAGRLDTIVEDSQYSLLPRLSQASWCKRTLGGVVFAAPSLAGRAFLDHTCLQIRKFLRSGLYWFAFDQYALYRAMLYMKRREALVNFRALGWEHVSFDLSADAPILYPKGKSKESDRFKSLMKSAMLPEPAGQTADLSDIIFAEAESSADAGRSEGIEICAD